MSGETRKSRGIEQLRAAGLTAAKADLIADEDRAEREMAESMTGTRKRETETEVGGGIAGGGRGGR